MRKLLIIFASIATLMFVFDSHKVAGAPIKITEQQMKNVCGKDVKSGGGQTGCTKKCGNNWCDYNCNKKGCTGDVVAFEAPEKSKGKPPTTGILDSSAGFSRQGPAATGAPAAPAAPAGGGMIR